MKWNDSDPFTPTGIVGTRVRESSRSTFVEVWVSREGKGPEVEGTLESTIR